jgi:hypothetical protein
MTIPASSVLRAGFKARRESFPGKQFHREVAADTLRVPMMIDLINGADVGMGHLASQENFPLKPILRVG